jgi:hypothetical protein
MRRNFFARLNALVWVHLLTPAAKTLFTDFTDFTDQCPGFR